MQLNDYQKATQRTYPDLGSEKLNIAHMIMGMVSELNELDEAIQKDDIINIGEESSDVEWYLSNYCRLFYINYNGLSKKIDTYDSINNLLLKLTSSISKLCDIEKKYIAYNKEVNHERRVDFVNNIFECISSLYSFFNLDGEKCRDNNIEKLKIRFPKSFTEENAINRDLESERKALEA